MALRLIGFLAGLLWLTTAHASAGVDSEQPSKPPHCNALSYANALAIHPDAFASITMELAIDDYRGWVKKKIKSYVSLAKRGHARKQKRTRGVMTIRTKSGLSCTLRVKFRAHGDLSDHYPDDMAETPSLNVKLVDGHILGITKFVLFRPEKRAI